MEELTRRKSNSSESELSDGWNLVDAVEVLPVETSDNESVEVIQDEVTDDHSEGEKEYFKTYSNPEERIESLNAVEKKNELRNVMEEWHSFLNFKEFCEVTTVFLVLGTMALSSLYSLLWLEEGISSAKPIIWNTISSRLGNVQQLELEQMKNEVDSLKKENLKLVSELHNLNEALTSSRENENIYLKSSSGQSFSKDVENSMGEIFLNRNIGIQKLDTTGFDFSDYKMFENVFKDTQENNFKSHLEFLSSIQKNLEQILIVTTNYSENYSPSNTSFPIQLLIEDFETINIVSVEEKLSTFASKWDNKFKSFIANIQSDLVKMTKKLSSNLNKKLLSFHLKFLSRLCDKVIYLGSETLSTRQKEVCLKHLEASKNGMKDKKVENSKKYFKPIKEKTSGPRKGSSVKKNTEGDIEVKSDNHGSEGLLQGNRNEHSSFYQQASEKSRKNKQEANSNEIKNESHSNKKANLKTDSQQNKNNPKNERDLKKSKKETSTKKIKESIICKEGDGKVQVESKIEKSDNVPSNNKRGNNQNFYESDELKKNKKTSDLKIKTNIKEKKVLDVDKYDAKVEHVKPEENKIISQESSVILPYEEYKKKSKNLKNGSNKSDHKMNKPGKKQNTNSTGVWFFSMGESRANIRNEHQKSEWLFERARARLKNRDNSRWAFDRAWVRQRCRESPKSSLCWQRNIPIPDSYFTKSSDAFS